MERVGSGNIGTAGAAQTGCIRFTEPTVRAYPCLRQTRGQRSRPATESRYSKIREKPTTGTAWAVVLRSIGGSNEIIDLHCLSFSCLEQPGFFRRTSQRGEKKLRLVCQAYAAGKFIDRVMILDQLTTRTYPEHDYTPEITGEMMLKPHKRSQGGQGVVLGLVKGRLRVYEGVGPGLIISINDPVTGESIGVKVGKDFDSRLEDLLKTQVGKDRIGRKMDYSGVIDRGFGLNDIARIHFYHGDPSDIDFRRDPGGLRSYVRSARPQYPAYFRTSHETFVDFPDFRRGEYSVDYTKRNCICGPPIFVE